MLEALHGHEGLETWERASRRGGTA
jgi:hypothetical protein